MDYGTIKHKNNNTQLLSQSILHQYEGGGQRSLNLILDNIYPIGSIYISVNAINPSEYFGGVWEQFAQGKTLFGVDSTQTDFNTTLKTGGSMTHQHFYRIGYRPYYGALTGGDSEAIMAYNYGTQSWSKGTKDAGIGASPVRNKGLTASYNEIDAARYSVGAYTQYTSTLPPYIVVYMWKRIS